MARWLSVLGSLAGVALGLVFLFAALIKAADPELFATQITGYKLTPESWGLFLAYLLIIVELVLGAAVLLHVAPRLSTVALLLLLVFFIGATAIAWSQGNVKECGCFGRAASRGPLGVIVEDTLFILLGALALKWAKPWASDRARWTAFLIVLPLLVALPWIGPRLPVDRWVTAVGPGADLSNMAVDGLKMPIQEGRVLLAFYGPDCDRCVQSLPGLDAIALAEKGNLQVVAVLAGDQRAARAFRIEHVPSFPIGYSPETVLRQYYRQVPVFVLLEDGVVARAWWRQPPEPEELASLR